MTVWKKKFLGKELGEIMSELLEKILKEKDKQIEELKKRLEARDTSFNKNLQNRVDKIFYALQKSIGEAIVNSVDQNYKQVFKYHKMYLDFESCSYGTSFYKVSFVDDKSVKEIKQNIADFEMQKFQESLDNFSWAVNQQDKI